MKHTNKTERNENALRPGKGRKAELEWECGRELTEQRREEQYQIKKAAAGIGI